MEGYGQFCAVARALDVLGERWTLLVVRELLLGATSFTDIRRGLPRIPRATLSSRLRRLRKAGILDEGYCLTETGTALVPVVRELARWAVSTESAALKENDLDTVALSWDIQRRIDLAALPDHTVVLALWFTDGTAPDDRFWLHLSPAGVNLCRTDTGAAVDIWLKAPTLTMTKWWLGELSWADFIGHEDVTIHGDRALERQAHTWFQRYVFTPEALHESRASC